MDAVGTAHRARAADGTNVTSAADDMFIGALSSRESMRATSEHRLVTAISPGRDRQQSVGDHPRHRHRQPTPQYGVVRRGRAGD
jgi:hypothetical protein